MKKEKNRDKKFNTNIIFYILDALLVIIAIYFMLGYINFYKYSNDQKPLFTFSEKKYQVPDGNVTVKNYYIYKIVRHEVTNNSVTYGLKLWFMKDVK